MERRCDEDPRGDFQRIRYHRLIILIKPNGGGNGVSWEAWGLQPLLAIA
jgi:hypothetical protein